MPPPLFFTSDDRERQTSALAAPNHEFLMLVFHRSNPKLEHTRSAHFDSPTVPARDLLRGNLQTVKPRALSGFSFKGEERGGCVENEKEEEVKG